MIKQQIGFIALCGLLSLSGCSGLMTSKDKIDKFYTLNAADSFPPNTFFIDESIIIEKPLLAKGLDSQQIMLMRSAQRLDYYAGARWSTMLDKMIQMSVIESFENSDVLSKVSSEHASVNADYALVLDVFDFQAEYQNINEPPVIHVKMVAKLVTFPSRDIVATFGVEAYEQAKENELADVMFAFDHAFKAAQKLIIEESVDYFTSL